MSDDPSALITTDRIIGRSVLSLALLGMAFQPAAAPAAARLAPPAQETKCTLQGWVAVADRQLLSVRAKPRADARIVGVLPTASARGAQFPVHISIIGARAGWLKIAHSSDARNGAQARAVFGGEGWIEGAAGLRIESSEGYAKPDVRSKKLVDLGGEPLSDTGWVEAVVGCSGNWVLADYRLRIPRGVRARLPRWPSRAWFQRTCGLAMTVCSVPASTKVPTGAARARPTSIRI
ncbi:hypothetical protein ACSBM8_17925 [Sphingomonas sp. ASY06-1R]|uniref:hypothetical protein n=1 Tax=Sphingomonas sp. ASY06-1R TaxID=3445771 RepID=UPI003FA1E476